METDQKELKKYQRRLKDAQARKKKHCK